MFPGVQPMPDWLQRILCGKARQSEDAQVMAPGRGTGHSTTEEDQTQTLQSCLHGNPGITSTRIPKLTEALLTINATGLLL